MRTDDIADAFKAIVEEAEQLQDQNLPENAGQKIKTIISIAKHQNDIRRSTKGSCKAQ
ncbi:MAG: hypothetical protein JJV98_10195 [Desulfosarcina sp.]|nr:hypothetical protein [Desulfobacterales bacterium]